MRKKNRVQLLFLSIAFMALYAWSTPVVYGALPGGTLDPTTIPKYEDPLVIPPVMPPSNGQSSYYKVEMRQFEQTVLPSSLGLPTTVWGYGPADDATNENFHSPAFTFETRSNEAVQVDWINGLVDENGDFLPHLLPVDPTLHWANPPGGEMHKDMRPVFEQTPGPYMGPVPTVPHLHGAHVADHSDGYPEAWYLPAANNIEAGYATFGSHYTSQDASDDGATGKALYEYSNDQRATTLWYHDHALGMTRLNVYAGLAGFWLIRDAQENSLNLPGPAPKPGEPLWQPQKADEAPPYGEIPIVIQDRSFNDDGSLFYPDTREFFDEYAGPYVPETPIPPMWNPEFFGNTIMVNGRTWPYLNVEPKKYRFRLLNGSNSRFLVLKLNEIQEGVSCFVKVAGASPGGKSIKFNQIGNDGGLLPGKPAVLSELLLGPAERADVIVDFSKFKPGSEIIMLNLGPDEPFGGLPLDEGTEADPETTGQVMKFKVVPLKGKDRSSLPFRLPNIDPLPASTMIRDLTLNEHAHMPNPDDPDGFDGPVAAMLGTAADGPLMWMDDITENPILGDTEVWRIFNLTEDAHPIHLHLVQFEIIGRAPFDSEGYEAAQDAAGNPNILDFVDPAQEIVGPEPGEKGRKDTLIVYPGEFAMVKATFDLPGLYVWHCHILEHEDNEMMRPYEVVAP